MKASSPQVVWQVFYPSGAVLRSTRKVAKVSLPSLQMGVQMCLSIHQGRESGMCM